MKKFLIVLTFVIAGIAAFLYYLGIFQKMEVSESSFGPYQVLYREHKGAYEKVGEVFREMMDYQEKVKINSEMMFGIYYDDPEKIEEHKLRSEIGLVLNKEDHKRLKAENKDEKIKFKSIPRREYIFTIFPYKNMASAFIGIFKAYPTIDTYVDNNYPEHEHKKN